MAIGLWVCNLVSNLIADGIHCDTHKPPVQTALGNMCKVVYYEDEYRG